MDEKFFYIGFFCMADANDQIDLGIVFKTPASAGSRRKVRNAG
ncbi:hypothetical protein [Ralstonia pseudosolanacearum]|nr:hypothetical protein [Ralstonia pseudosolanacearum]